MKSGVYQQKNNLKPDAGSKSKNRARMQLKILSDPVDAPILNITFHNYCIDIAKCLENMFHEYFNLFLIELYGAALRRWTGDLLIPGFSSRTLHCHMVNQPTQA